MAERPAEPNESMLQLWADVSASVEKNSTVLWTSASQSMKLAHAYFLTCKEARTFAETTMGPMIAILLDQQSHKIGLEERRCIQESVIFAVAIVAADLEVQIHAKQECKLLSALEIALDKSKMFYKGIKATWHMGSPGMPEVRMNVIDRFRRYNGFVLLADYLALTSTATTPMAAEDAARESIPPPSLTLLHHVLTALYDAIKPPSVKPRNPPPPVANNNHELVLAAQKDAVRVGQAVMHYIYSANDDTLKKLSTEQVSDLQADLRILFDRVGSMPKSSQRVMTMAFYKYWRDFIWKLLSSGSLPLKLFGWEQLADMLEACAAHRPPPRYYLVTKAGCEICNGRYEFGGAVTEDGYVVPGDDVLYVYNIPPDVIAAAEANGAAETMEQEASMLIRAPLAPRSKLPKRLTIFRCTMRSSQKWWFLSEADEDQPGTDKDVDYYQHKSKESEEAQPPSEGWITCKNAGIEPPPVLLAKGVMVPQGEEYNTLDHQVAKWAIENEIVEQVLGDTTIHREVVARSTVLIKFLASMRDRYPPSGDAPEASPPTEYCLLPSHLLYAWKTCLRKADAAVSSQVYQLLVSVLPLCPADLANPLLRAVQDSLGHSDEEEDHLFEVSEFCSALASGILDAKSVDIPLLKDEVREEVLNLLWSVLTHPKASSLRSYDTLKRYVTHELKVEPNGRKHRDKLVRACIDALNVSANTVATGGVNEVQVLRMVGLTKFVLDACPREQAVQLVTADAGSVPMLLFLELTAYLNRKRTGGTSNFHDSSSVAHPGIGGEDANSSAHALAERLRIIRYAHGLCDPSQLGGGPVLTVDMVKTLWGLCDAPDDREALMVFIAQASQCDKVFQYDLHPQLSTNHGLGQSEPILHAALSKETALAVFLELFCSSSLTFEYLGEPGYKSFQSLFAATQSSTASGDSRDEKAVIEALWRICLVGNDGVAALAMKDLLNMYISTAAAQSGNGMDSRLDKFHDFRERVLQCLTLVKDQLKSDGRAASRSTERCLKILNAAIGQSNFEGHSLCSSTLVRLKTLLSEATLDDVAMIVPHGMRGRGSYCRVGIQAKRPQIQPQPQGESSSRPTMVKFSLDLHPLETLASVKQKVASNCQCPVASIKLIQVTGRAARHNGVESYQNNSMNLNVVPEDTSVDELGIIDGCELVVVVTEPRPVPPINATAPLSVGSRGARSHDLTEVFFENGGTFSDRLFEMLIDVLKFISWSGGDDADEELNGVKAPSAHFLVWEFLLAMPTNKSIATAVRSTVSRKFGDTRDDAMDVEHIGDSWSQLLDFDYFDRSVYVLLTIDGLLRPATEVLSILGAPLQEQLSLLILGEAGAFRRSFVEVGGFQHVARFFSDCGSVDKSLRSKTRRGNAVALRILKSCLFGDTITSDGAQDDALDDIGRKLLDSLSSVQGLLTSLLAMVIDDPGISSSAIADVLRFLSLLFQSPSSTQSVQTLPGTLWEDFLVKSLTHEEDPAKASSSSSISAAMHVRRSAHDLILQTPLLADRAIPWLTRAIAKIDVKSECSAECFDVLEKLLSNEKMSSRRSRALDDKEVAHLFRVVCEKLVVCPRPRSESEALDISTGVLCGCMKLLRAIVECKRASILVSGVTNLLAVTGASQWCETGTNDSDRVLVNLMGVVFDYFLSPVGASSVAVCCDKESRRSGFDVVEAATMACETDIGYSELISHINALVAVASPGLKHRWGQFGANNVDSNSRTKSASKYSGLKNAGCTCYMNSVLQQLFMMSEIRNSLCSVPLPTALRMSGGVALKGSELVGKKLSFHWETGVSYDAIVESFDEETGAHCIRYCPMNVATTGHNSNIDPNGIARLPPNLPDEFVLSEGRPGKETGVYEIVAEASDMETDASVHQPQIAPLADEKLSESEDERASRRLLEEVQRTFIHLDEGARGKHFDPKALVEACACLKLEFDVWQQNDASEFATKLLDRLEISLKKWAPVHFQYLDHMFGIKQIKQKICRECGLKTSREEKLLNIDCQIRGKTDIREALATFTETEIMEGSNQVFCETCSKNTDTILRTAISTLPNVLILSLKRFDLDFTTFETVKLNSRCAFGQTLNMKDYTLEGLDANEKDVATPDTTTVMDTDESSQDCSRVALDQAGNDADDYEYRLAGVLVHAGVAQGGHYYSFIRERNSGSDDKWYRFDDEDVTPFDPANIETECFGGRIKKETKWPNGQVHTVEQEQFANALMLFYEKVKPSDSPTTSTPEAKDIHSPSSTGYEVFKADVLRSNSAHRWQAFLFDSEFQFFLKRLLGGCALPSPLDATPQLWRQPLLQMLLGYFFDVMPYAVDCGFVHDWVKTLEQALYTDAMCARRFVHSLATRTTQVSSNWFRSFLLECPDEATRAGAARVFGAAIRSCLTFEEERSVLDAWARSWQEQTQALRTEPYFIVPSMLTKEWAYVEAVEKFDQGGSSSVGRLISYLNVLLDALPRCWRFYSEPLVLVRLMAIMRVDDVFVLRPALIAALMPIRLIAIAVRDRLVPHSLREAFPGASLAHESAGTQARAESSNSHLISMSGSHTHLNENGQRGPGAETAYILETLACIASLPGAANAVLVVEMGEMIRGRRRYMLTEAASQALETIFHEHCAPGSPGMGRRELEIYLNHCGIDTNQGVSQRISDMMRKSAVDDTVSTPKYLNMSGFVQYYRDTVQSNDIQLRMDLHRFGFRPDLSRRSLSARTIELGGRMVLRDPTESVGIDVAETFGEHVVEFGAFAGLALNSTLPLHELAFRFSELHGVYLLAAATYNRDASDLIVRLLDTIISSPTDWQGNEKVGNLVFALRIIAEVPDSKQAEKISVIMNCQSRRNTEFGLGLLSVVRYLREALSSHMFNNEARWLYARYINVLKMLRTSSTILRWMQANKSSWAIVEHDLTGDRASSNQQAHHIRDDFMARDDLGTYGPHEIGDRNTDQDDMDIGDMNDDSDGDEDSRFSDNMLNGELTADDQGSTTYEPSGGPIAIQIHNAGSDEVNGVYKQVGHYRGAYVFSRVGPYRDNVVTFSVFLCDVSNNTKHWYISIVPAKSHPGTSADTDFYTAPYQPDAALIPPRVGWVTAGVGRDPAPFLDHIMGPAAVEEEEEEEDEESFGIYPDGEDTASLDEDTRSSIA